MEKKPLRRKDLIFIILDGVSFDVLDNIQRKGVLPFISSYFQTKCKLISSYPSLTRTSAAELLGLEQVEGYEGVFFDVKTNKIDYSYIRKAIFHDISHKLPYKSSVHGFNILKKNYSHWLSFLFPRRGLKTELKNLEKLILSGSSFKNAWVFGTDEISHRYGYKGVMNALIEVDKTLESSIPKSGKEVVLLSDHGNYFDDSHQRCRIIDYVMHPETLSRLEESEIIFTSGWGLLNVINMNLSERHADYLSKEIAEFEGVHSTIYKKENEIVLYDSSGKAIIDLSEGKQDYRPITSDPIGYAEISESLNDNDKRYNDAWFEATKEHEFPDAIRRIQNGFTIPLNPATMFVNLKNGFYEGNSIFDKFVNIRSTHGNLSKESSVGFLLTRDENKSLNDKYLSISQVKYLFD